jgi:hypothetical protein
VAGGILAVSDGHRVDATHDGLADAEELVAERWNARFEGEGESAGVARMTVGDGRDDLWCVVESVTL